MFYPSYVTTSSKHITKRQYSSLNRNDVGTGKLVICVITKECKQILLRITFIDNAVIFYYIYFSESNYDKTQYHILANFVRSTIVTAVIFCFLNYMPLD